MGALKVVVVLIGLIIFAKYDGCDPIKAKVNNFFKVFSLIECDQGTV